MLLLMAILWPYTHKKSREPFTGTVHMFKNELEKAYVLVFWIYGMFNVEISMRAKTFYDLF